MRHPDLLPDCGVTNCGGTEIAGNHLAQTQAHPQKKADAILSIDFAAISWTARWISGQPGRRATRGPREPPALRHRHDAVAGELVGHRGAIALGHRRATAMTEPGVLEGLSAPVLHTVYAVTPFNFTAIGGNFSTSPRADGEHRPSGSPPRPQRTPRTSSTQLLEEAGLPDGVINLVYGSGAEIGDAALASRASRRCALHRLDRRLPEHVEDDRLNIAGYRNYPRIVGETGGKDFIVAHESGGRRRASPRRSSAASFEYQGQKCSAASRLFIPDNIWPELRERLATDIDAPACR